MKRKMKKIVLLSVSIMTALITMFNQNFNFNSNLKNDKVNALGIPTTINIDSTNYDQYFTPGGTALDAASSPMINGVDSVQLTQYFAGLKGQSGSSSFNQYIDLTQDFTMQAQVYLGDGMGGSDDGITFVLHKGSVGQTGEFGGGIGSMTLPEGVAVEFDTYKNQDVPANGYSAYPYDPDNHHIMMGYTDKSKAWDIGQTGARYLMAPTTPSGVGDVSGPLSTDPGQFLDDGLWHNVTFDWKAPTNLALDNGVLSCNYTDAAGKIYTLQQTNPFGAITTGTDFTNRFYTFAFTGGTNVNPNNQQAVRIQSLAITVTPTIGGYVFDDVNHSNKLEEMKYVAGTGFIVTGNSTSNTANAWATNKPIVGAKVYLYKADGVTPMLDSTGSPVFTTTGPNGHYSFTYDQNTNPNFTAGSATDKYVIKTTQPDLSAPYTNSSIYKFETGLGFDGSNSQVYDPNSIYSVVDSNISVPVDLTDINSVLPISDNYNIGVSQLRYPLTAVVDTSTTNGATGTVGIVSTQNPADVSPFLSGDTITLSPPSIPNYTFSSWAVDLGGVTVSVAKNDFTMPQTAVSIRALYNKSAYKVTASVDTSSTGGANPAVTIADATNNSTPPNYDVGTTVGLTAPVIPNYVFSHWNVTTGGVTVSAANDFVMPQADVNVQAVYAYNVYKVTATVDTTTTGGATGTVAITDPTNTSTPPNYDGGTTVTLAAPVIPNYTFSSWKVTTGGITVSAANNFVMPRADVTVQALYAQSAYQVVASVDTTSTGGATGTVVITDPTNTSTPPNYDVQTTVGLTPPTIPNYKFDHWNVVTGGIKVSAANDFLMPASDVNVQAVYIQSAYQVVASVDTTSTGGATGTVVITDAANTATTPNYDVGTTVGLTAPTITNYKFDHWNVVTGGITVSLTNDFVMPASDVNVQAVYVQSAYTVDATVDTTSTGGATGTVVIKDAKNTATPPNYDVGTTVGLTAPVIPTYTFDHWDIINPTTGLVISSTNDFVMPSSNVVVKAVYVRTKYSVVATVDTTTTGGKTGTVTITDPTNSEVAPNYTIGSTVTLAAPAIPNYKFDHWNIINPTTGLVISSTNDFIMPTSNVVVKAVYVQDAYTVIATVDTTTTNGTTGIVTITDPTSSAVAPYYTVGSNVTLVAPAIKGYTFVSWTVVNPKTGLVVSKTGSFTMPNANVVIKAVYSKDAVPTPTPKPKPSLTPTGVQDFTLITLSILGALLLLRKGRKSLIK